MGRHRCLNLKDIFENEQRLPHPKDSFSILAPKIKYMAPNFKYTVTKFKYIAPKLKYIAPKFKYYIKFSYTVRSYYTKIFVSSNLSNTTLKCENENKLPRHFSMKERQGRRSVRWMLLLLLICAHVPMLAAHNSGAPSLLLCVYVCSIQ